MTGGDATGWWVGVDIGGTFTDFIAIDDEGRLVVEKLPSTPDAPESAVRQGLARLRERFAIAPRSIRFFGHGSTVGTNTLLERNGVRVGLLVTAGFEDLLVLGRLVVGAGSLQADAPAALVPSRLVRGIHERLRADGMVRERLDESEVAAAARELVAEGVAAIAVCFLHSYRYPRHEDLAVEVVRRELPGLPVWGSARVWPEIREYERAVTTCINAYIGPRVSAYYGAVARHLEEIGVSGPFLASQGNGGVALAAEVVRRPIITLQSGPASGAAAAWQIARSAGHDRLVAVDIGGTSTDVAILDGGIRFSTDAKVGDFPVMLPTVDVSSVGAGGGSLAWLDAGVLKVGPRSAGAQPGPAAYRRGGTLPTLTDAYVALGYMGEGSLGDGTVRIDRTAAEASFVPLAGALGATVGEVAAAVVRIASSAMFAEVSRLCAAHGMTPSELEMIVYGGAGPTHGFLLASELGCRRVLVPLTPGLLCALGCVISDARAEFAKTISVALAGQDRAALPAVTSGLRDLAATAAAWCDTQGFRADARRFDPSADFRYVGQAYTLTVPLPGRLDDPTDLTLPFHAQHERTFGHSDPGAAVELVTLRLTAHARLPKPRLAGTKPRSVDRAASSRPRSRQIDVDGRLADALVLERSELSPGFSAAGPVIVEQYDTTVFVPPGWRFTIEESGLLIGERA